MKKIKLFEKIGGGGNLRLLPQGFWGYTLAEVIIVMLIIAVIVSVTIGITKAKLDNVLSYTYYNAYSTLREITRKMLADWDPTDPEYKQALSKNTVKYAFNFPNDYKFFSILISHSPFKLQLPIDRNRAKAGNQITVYSCPKNASYYYFWKETTRTTSYYYSTIKKCLPSDLYRHYKYPGSYPKCPGKYRGADTFRTTNGSCNLNCTTMEACSGTNCNCGPLSSVIQGTGTCGKYMFSSVWSIYCGINDKCIDNSLGKLTHAKLISSTRIEGNVCQNVIECDEGYQWETHNPSSSDAHGLFSFGDCYKVVDAGGGACNKTCGLGYTLDKTSCTCMCTRSCSSGYTLNKETCSCDRDKYTCWDGSKVDYSFQCPSKVTCWDGSYAHNKSECPACTNKPATIPCGQSWDDVNCKITGSKKTCSSSYAPNLNPTTCECYANCWDGTTANYSWNCPTKYTCWDGSFVHNTSECPPCTKTCSSGYYLDSYYCTCKKIQVTCWDGSKADTYAECPSYVTCWDGSKKYNYSQCPACPNKPRCPAGNWSDITCTGDSKMCPAGQHLNSGCSCVNDCPSAAELTPCRLCSDETGEITKNPDINRTCSDETYEWSEEQCKCIISPRTLPRQGANFCKLFEANANIMGNTDVCQGSAIASNTTDFSDKKPDVTLRNGLRIYNMHNDATAIAMLEGNTQGGVYDGVPNTNAYGYTVYIDIDGVKGDSRLWSDVYPFYITLSGKVIPGYDSSANPNGAGGDSTSHMQVSVEYEHFNSGKRAISWLAKSVPFKEGACLSGYVGDATPYCRNNPAVTKAPNCTTESDSVCRVKQILPVKFFF